MAPPPGVGVPAGDGEHSPVGGEPRGEPGRGLRPRGRGLEPEAILDQVGQEAQLVLVGLGVGADLLADRRKKRSVEVCVCDINVVKQ